MRAAALLSDLIFAVAIWLGMSAILPLAAFVGGWHRLADTYRARYDPQGQRYIFASVGIKGRLLLGAHYSRCLTGYVSPYGTSLRIWLPFRFFHPPLFIPWRAVQTVEMRRWLFFTIVRVRLSTDEELTFTGGLGKTIASEWESFRKSVANWQ
jgi:hypothetical protein